MVVKTKFRYPLFISQCRFWIIDFGFWIGGIASLYPLIKQAEYLNSSFVIRNSSFPLSRLVLGHFFQFIVGPDSDFDPAVLGTPGGGVVGGHRLRFAVSLRGKTR